MAISLNVIQIGNSVGVILPKEVLAQLSVEKGDQLFLTNTPEGIQLTPYRPEMAEKIAVLEKVMRENRDVLHELAK